MSDMPSAYESVPTYASDSTQPSPLRTVEVRMEDIVAMRDEQARLARERDYWEACARTLLADELPPDATPQEVNAYLARMRR